MGIVGKRKQNEESVQVSGTGQRVWMENCVRCGCPLTILAVERPTRMKSLGVPGVFAPTGSAEFLLEHFGLTAEGIEGAVKDLAGATVGAGREAIAR